MQAAQNMGQDGRVRRRSGADLRSMGNGLRGRLGEVWRGFIQRAAGIGLEVIHRDRVCLALAVTFTVGIVVPSILIGWDRTLPYEFIDARIMESAAAPGQEVDIRYTVRNVSKECSGTVHRIFIDSSGRTFFLGESPTIYQLLLAKGENGVFDRQWKIPPGAAPGPGLYVAYPKFWCYPLQWLYPVKPAVPYKATVTVVRGGR